MSTPAHADEEEEYAPLPTASKAQALAEPDVPIQTVKSEEKVAHGEEEDEVPQKRRLKRNDAVKGNSSEEEAEIRRPGPAAKKRAMLNDSDNEEDIVSKASSKENKNLFNAATAAPVLSA